MEHMVKVVRVHYNIALDQDAFDMSEATTAAMAARVGNIYGCDEVEVYFPNGDIKTVRIK